MDKLNENFNITKNPSIININPENFEINTNSNNIPYDRVSIGENIEIKLNYYKSIASGKPAFKKNISDKVNSEKKQKKYNEFDLKSKLISAAIPPLAIGGMGISLCLVSGMHLPEALLTSKTIVAVSLPFSLLMFFK